MPVLPHFVFQTSRLFGSYGTLKSTIDGAFSFVGADGGIVAATSEEVPVKETTDDIQFSITPARELLADNWYSLVVQQAPGFHVVTDSGAREWMLRFFTGSAPHVVSIAVSLKGGPPRIQLSEPVDVSTIPIAGLLSDAAGGKSVCVLAGTDCMSISGPVMMDQLVVKYSGALVKGSVVDQLVTTSLPATAQGSGRSVGDGALVAGFAPSASAGLARTILPNEWQPCDGELCWFDDSALP